MSGWQEVGAVEAFPPGATRLSLEGKRLALFRIGDDFYVIGDVCSHEWASLSEGDLWDYDVECPLHGAAFDVRTGEPQSLPATKPVPTYSVRVSDGRVMVNLDPNGEAT